MEPPAEPPQVPPLARAKCTAKRRAHCWPERLPGLQAPRRLGVVLGLRGKSVIVQPDLPNANVANDVTTTGSYFGRRAGLNASATVDGANIKIPRGRPLPHTVRDQLPVIHGDNPFTCLGDLLVNPANAALSSVVGHLITGSTTGCTAAEDELSLSRRSPLAYTTGGT